MSTLTRTMTSPAITTPSLTSPSLTTSLNKIPFKILEIKVISAHDLPPVSERLHTYVMAWAHPDHKMITPVDHKGNTNPTWNYRMVFGVDDKFLSSESSAVMIEIYNISRLSNKPIGTTSLPVEILLNNPHSEIMKKPLRLQICRPSGDLKGFLIVTVNLVNTTIRNRNEVDESSPRKFMIRQFSHRLSHSESCKRVTFHEEEEEYDDDVNTMSDPERGSVDLEMKHLPSDAATALDNNVAPPETSTYNDWTEAADHNFNEESTESSSSSKNVVKLGEDKILFRGEEPKVRSRHRRHSDGGGGLLSYFTRSFICGAGSMSNKKMNKKLMKKSTKKSKDHVINYPPDKKNLRSLDI